MAELRRYPLECDLPAHAAVELVGADAHPVALSGRWAGGGAIAASEPVRVAQPDEDPFALLDEQPTVTGATPAGSIGGGWLGWLGYPLGAMVEALAPEPPPPCPDLPVFALAFYDHVARRDAEGRWWFEELWTPERGTALAARRELLAERAAHARAAAPVEFSTGEWTLAPSPAGHAAAVAACRERIAAGDLYQANLGVRLEADLNGDPAALFTRAAAALEPDRGAYVAGPWGAVASLSPELFLERHGHTVRSAPIKGTATANGRDRLAASEKDRAENVMIVDLVRNDLGRVCRPGTVAAPVIAQPRAHVGVWHLVSEVCGELADGAGDADLVRAAFPPGSVTGAPKLAAMDVIAELEGVARRAWTGAIGFASPVAGLELSVAIRTFEIAGGRVRLHAGGGVTAGSDPAAEAQECLDKAAPLLAAIGSAPPPGFPGAPSVGSEGHEPFDPTLAAPRGTSVESEGSQPLETTVGGRVPPRLGPRPVPRPDPRAGIFDTLACADGEPVALAAHAARLRASALSLYGASLPELEAVVREAATGAPPGRARLRVEAIPSPHGMELRAEALPYAPPGAPAALRSVPLAGGLGAHKWRDRALLDALADHAGHDAELLLVDLDDLVLESARANVIALDGDTLLTPPLDGRILPGVGRAHALAAARRLGLEISEEPLPRAALIRASGGAALCSALRGIHPIATVDGAPTAAPGDALRALAGALAPHHAPPIVT